MSGWDRVEVHARINDCPRAWDRSLRNDARRTPAVLGSAYAPSKPRVAWPGRSLRAGHLSEPLKPRLQRSGPAISMAGDMDAAEAGTFSRCRPFSFSVVNCPRRNNVNGIGVHACLLWEQEYRTEVTLVQRSPEQPVFTSHLLPPESRGDLCSQLLKWQRSARYSFGHFQQPDPDLW